MKDVNIRLDKNAVKLVMRGLNKLPYEEAAPLIEDINRQVVISEVKKKASNDNQDT